jgi:hypothetical protein
MVAEHDGQSCHALSPNHANLHTPRGRLKGDDRSKATQWEVHGLNSSIGLFKNLPSWKRHKIKVRLQAAPVSG